MNQDTSKIEYFSDMMKKSNHCNVKIYNHLFDLTNESEQGFSHLMFEYKNIEHRIATIYLINNPFEDKLTDGSEEDSILLAKYSEFGYLFTELLVYLFAKTLNFPTNFIDSVKDDDFVEVLKMHQQFMPKELLTIDNKIVTEDSKVFVEFNISEVAKEDICLAVRQFYKPEDLRLEFTNQGKFNIQEFNDIYARKISTYYNHFFHYFTYKTLENN
jgi:hypothetical protein